MMPSLSRFVLRAAPAVAAALLLLSAPALAQPTNDTCANASVVQPSGLPYNSGPINTTSAGNDTGDPSFSCGQYTPPYPPGAYSKSVWFQFTPSVTDRYTISTNATGYSGGSIVGVYTGICGALSPVAGGCSENTGTANSIGSLTLNAGTTYYVLVAGVGSRNPLNPTQIVASTGGTLTLQLLRTPVTYTHTYLIPSVANVSGLTLFQSDLFLTNLEEADADYQVQFLSHGNAGDTTTPSNQPATGNLTVQGGGSREYPNVLGGLFNNTVDFGALVVRSTRRLSVGAKTYSPGTVSGSTYGQFTHAVEITSGTSGWDAPLAQNETGRFTGIRGSGAANVSGSRTNFVLFNGSATPCLARVTVRDQNGGQYAAPKDYTIPPNTMIQVNNVKDTFAIGSDIAAGSITVLNVGGCLMSGAAYVIDNVTQDPYTVGMRK